MLVLGISAFYHDSAAALVRDGDIVAAAQEERFTRIKHDSGFPAAAIAYCLAEGGVDLGDVDHVVFYDKPFLKFERLLETYLAFAPKGFRSFRTSMPVWVKEKLFQKSMLRDFLKLLAGSGRWNGSLLFTEHHESHAASAFFPSPFGEAAILTMDGVGEWSTTSLGIGRGRHVEITREIHFPHSLGLLYSAFTYHTGFKVNSGEYKVMGLAPYGEPRFARTIMEHVIDIKEGGSFRLDQSYFDYCTGLTMTNAAFDRLVGGPPRRPEEELTQRHMDLAASVQAVTEEVMLRMARSIRRETGQRHLCMAGGVALNCVANGRIHAEGIFDRIWIQPAAGDAGGALGAALCVAHELGDAPRSAGVDRMKGAYLGPSFTNEQIAARLKAAGARFELLDEESLIARSADDLARAHAIGWMQGRMEFGPRALGGRSILGDARSPTMQKLLNLKVKFRESFRPFAPSVLREHVGDWFGLDDDSPYMLLVAGVAERRRRRMTADEEALFGIDKLNVVRSEIPAVTHVDYSARIQTVHADTNPRYHALIERFRSLTGCPVIVNTSFNVRGEPIVCTPEDAFRCFMGTGIEHLAIGDCYLSKSEQDSALELDYSSAFELD
ncbi:MAG: carbamoyltransferase [Geminicoccaceae bacterium]|nr:carbamoyltransferase [Geminicoccaceae bacterium]